MSGCRTGNAILPPDFQLTVMLLGHTRRALAVTAVAAILSPLLALFAPFVAGQLKRTMAPATPTGPLPFRAGERLQYTVRWSVFLEAATAELRVVERRNFYGRDAWHFQAAAHTVGAVRLLYALDDQFDSYSDAATLAGLQYEMYIREQDEREDSIIRMGAEGEPALDDGPTVRVRRGTRDPLGFLYSLRAVDWPRVREVRVPVYDGKKLYDVWARLELEGEARVPAGSFSASKIALRAYERGREVSQARFWVWLAHGPARTPVLMEAEVPFGALRVELNKVADGP